MQKASITTPVYYANGLPHLGTSLSTVLADSIYRFCKAYNQSPCFLTGNDEHGGKVSLAAKEQNLTEQDFVDSLALQFQDVWKELKISNTHFVRTTDPKHIIGVQHAFKVLSEKDYIYKGVYSGWYDQSSETFYKAADLIDGKSPDGNPVIWLEEEGYYFRQSAFTDRVREFISSGAITPSVYDKEVLSYIIDEGLRDVCISRKNQPWGIPVPDDAEFTLYVWFDALLSYLTALGWPDTPDFNEFWPAKFQVVGKDILTRFHATLWPAILLGLELPLPRKIWCHSWITINGRKGAKSRRDIYTPEELAQKLTELAGVDKSLAMDFVRYYLVSTAPIEKDHEFSIAEFCLLYNSDFANEFGNLLNRTVGVLQKRFDGVVTPVSYLWKEYAHIQKSFDEACGHFNDLRPDKGLATVRTLAKWCNKYINDAAPWNSSEREAKESLYVCVFCLHTIAKVLMWITPDFADRIFRQLSLSTVNPTVPTTPWRVREAAVLVPRIDLKIDKFGLIGLKL